MMPEIAITDSVIDGFHKLVADVMKDPGEFHQRVGWGTYDNLIKELIACDEQINEDVLSKVNPTMVKRVVARIALMADMRRTDANSALIHEVLGQILVEASKHKECWLVYIPILGPWGPEPLRALEGGRNIMVRSGVSTWFDLSVISQNDKLLTDIFDHGVDNSVGAPRLGEFLGMRVRYVWTGRTPFDDDNGIDAAYYDFTSITCLWIEKLFSPIAVIRYPISLLCSSGANLSGYTPRLPQLIGPVAQPYKAIILPSNLWEFIDWFNESLERLPKNDESRLKVALDANRSAHLFTSVEMFIILSEVLAESLLGEGMEISRTVSQRAAWTRGYEADKISRQQIYSEEKKLYSFRNKIVHGRKWSSKLIGDSNDVKAFRLRVEKRNRELILRALQIERTEELKDWADQNLLG
ncbi:hypothetical protein CEB3_c02990 [Peptococcaceae bacterium CEB3]|nr:hypothetical protein CEB3_c02990 [Peptococcaceae bacterium CEB3]